MDIDIYRYIVNVKKTKPPKRPTAKIQVSPFTVHLECFQKRKTGFNFGNGHFLKEIYSISRLIKII